MMNQIKTPIEIEAIRESGRILSSVLKTVAAAVEPGITTGELDDLGRTEILKLGGKPTFIGYDGYTRSMCIAVNEEIQHAIPGARVIQAGDIVNLDSGVTYNGMITDSGITLGVGEISLGAQRLLTATSEALERGIAAALNGGRVGDISSAIEQRLRRDKLGIVKDLAGHGVGHELHEEPSVPNYGRSHKGARLRSGMTLAIEPIAAIGSGEMWVLDDGWTLVTRDGSWAAQFEHTILITPDGPEVLTR